MLNLEVLETKDLVELGLKVSYAIDKHQDEECYTILDEIENILVWRESQESLLVPSQ